MKSQISVIVPVYNGEKYLAQTLESVLAQTEVSIELVVVDDGSSDQSLQIAKTYTRTLLSQTNQGPGAARNVGILHASTEYIAFLDQDDLWHPEKLARQLECLQYADYAICKTIAQLEPDAQVFAHLIRQGYLDGVPAALPSALLTTKTIFEKIGLFNPSYIGNSDVDWFARANQHQLRLAYPEQVLLTKRIHHQNQGHDQKTAQELLKVLHHNLLKRRQA